MVFYSIYNLDQFWLRHNWHGAECWNGVRDLSSHQKIIFKADDD